MGRTIRKNIRHHQHPRAFVASPWHVTVVLNPLLDAARFWRGLERLVEVATGVSPRPDDSLVPSGAPAPTLGEEPA